MNHNVNIWYVDYLIFKPHATVIESPKGSRPHWSRTTALVHQWWCSDSTHTAWFLDRHVYKLLLYRPHYEHENYTQYKSDAINGDSGPGGICWWNLLHAVTDSVSIYLAGNLSLFDFKPLPWRPCATVEESYALKLDRPQCAAMTAPLPIGGPPWRPVFSTVSQTPMDTSTQCWIV